MRIRGGLVVAASLSVVPACKPTLDSNVKAHSEPSAVAPSAVAPTSAAPSATPAASDAAPAPSSPSAVASALAALSPADQARALAIVLAGDLAGDAMAKMNKGDGQGCLADLDRAKERDAKTEARLAMIRAQCEMLSGKCEAGTKRMREAYREHTGPESAARGAEAVASMRCKGGDTSPRIKLLGALFALSQGAYVERVEAAECQRLFREVKTLSQSVKPIDDADTQIKSVPDHVHFTTAKCLEKAGDCAAAVALVGAPDSAVSKAVSSIPDAAIRKKALDDSVRSMLPGCAPPAKP